jgi:hypothetical protein
MNIKADKIYECKFIKKDGTPREMLFTLRADLIPEVKGEPRKLPENLKTVYDLENQGWRTINLDTMVWLKEVEL